ncbi:hypothetical protein HY407_00845 [Candidatus Gottesmanbacteria bacterium]|nr:hypothetical protein [Candidatus Gottesmanbacteria bacterium]
MKVEIPTLLKFAKFVTLAVLPFAAAAINGRVISNKSIHVKGPVDKSRRPAANLHALGVGDGFRTVSFDEQYNPDGTPKWLAQLDTAEFREVKIKDNPTDLPDGTTAVPE